MSKGVGLVAGIIIVGSVLLGCKRVQVLVPSEAPRTTVREQDGALDISGKILHSSLEIYKITQDHAGSRIYLRVYLRPVPPTGGGPSDFRVRVLVPTGVDEVWLGDPPGRTTVATMFAWPIRVPSNDNADATPIWRRSS
jgi:hypothetical protein